MKRAHVVVLLGLWLALILVTHHGSRSPYTYVSELTIGMPPLSDLGRVGAPDALTIVPVTRFFYDGTLPARFDTAHNLWLPLHSFAASVGLSFVRHYLWANSAVNLLFLVLCSIAAVRFGTRHGLHPGALLLALATVFTLPPVVAVIGQPMHYIVAPAITFLVMLTALALGAEGLRNPWTAGALTAVLTLNYHWYVFVAALVVHLALIRFARRRDDLIYLGVAAGPLVIWELFVRELTGGGMSMTIRNRQVIPVLLEWADLAAHPIERVLMPHMATNIGWAMAFHYIVALIHWPLLVLVVCGLWIAYPRAGGWPGNRLLLLLLGFFFVEQMLSAAFDHENSPRRALPVFFVFAVAYCWLVDRFRGDRRWRIAFGAAFVFSAFFAFADVVFDRGGGAYLYVGEAVREPATAMRYEQRTLPGVSSIRSERQQALREPFPAAALNLTPSFVFAQLFVAFWMFVLFRIAARSGVLPRLTPWIAAGVWLVSLGARFV